MDTPGFGTKRQLDSAAKEKITNAIRGLDFTLLYCLPVYPLSVLGDAHKNILYNLQKCLHNRIWEKCVLLLTFSDDLLEHFNKTSNSNDEAIEKYKRKVTEYAASFQQLLTECISVDHEIKTVFDYRDDNSRRNARFPGIVAVPVRKLPDNKKQDSDEFDRTPDIIPGIPSTVNWCEMAMNEIDAKMASLVGELKVADFKFPVTTAGPTIAGGAAGAGGGAGIGERVCGSIGMAVGAIAIGRSSSWICCRRSSWICGWLSVRLGYWGCSVL